MSGLSWKRVGTGDKITARGTVARSIVIDGERCWLVKQAELLAHEPALKPGVFMCSPPPTSTPFSMVWIA